MTERKTSPGLFPHLRWTQLQHSPDILKRARASDFASIDTDRVHALYGYKALDGDARDLVWDAREDGGPAPMFIRDASTGAEMMLMAFSACRIHGMPVNVGERVLLEPSPARAAQMAREVYETKIKPDPERLAELQGEYDSEESFLAWLAEDAQVARVADLVTVTVGMTELLEARGANVMQDDHDTREVEVEFVYDDGTSQAFCSPSAAARAAEAAPLDQHERSMQELLNAMPGDIIEMLRRLDVEFTYFDRRGAELTFEQWLRYRSDESYRLLGSFEMQSKAYPQAKAVMVCEWLGMRVTICSVDGQALNEHRDFMFVHKTLAALCDKDAAHGNWSVMCWSPSEARAQVTFDSIKSKCMSAAGRNAFEQSTAEHMQKRRQKAKGYA